MKKKILNLAMLLLFLVSLGYCLVYNLYLKEIAYETFNATHEVIYSWFGCSVLLFTVGFFAFRVLTVNMTQTNPMPIFRILPILALVLLALHLLLGVFVFVGHISFFYWYQVIFSNPWIFIFPGMCCALTE